MSWMWGFGYLFIWLVKKLSRTHDYVGVIGWWDSLVYEVDMYMGSPQAPLPPPSHSDSCRGLQHHMWHIEYFLKWTHVMVEPSGLLELIIQLKLPEDFLISCGFCFENSLCLRLEIKNSEKILSLWCVVSRHMSCLNTRNHHCIITAAEGRNSGVRSNKIWSLLMFSHIAAPFHYYHCFLLWGDWRPWAGSICPPSCRGEGLVQNPESILDHERGLQERTETQRLYLPGSVMLLTFLASVPLFLHDFQLSGKNLLLIRSDLHFNESS